MSLDSSGTLNSTSYPLFIGARSRDNSRFNGVIDDVRIYNRVITDDEAELLYQSNF